MLLFNPSGVVVFVVEPLQGSFRPANWCPPAGRSFIGIPLEFNNNIDAITFVFNNPDGVEQICHSPIIAHKIPFLKHHNHFHIFCRIPYKWS